MRARGVGEAGAENLRPGTDGDAEAAIPCIRIDDGDLAADVDGVETAVRRILRKLAR